MSRQAVLLFPVDRCVGRQQVPLGCRWSAWVYRDVRVRFDADPVSGLLVLERVDEEATAAALRRGVFRFGPPPNAIAVSGNIAQCRAAAGELRQLIVGAQRGMTDGRSADSAVRARPSGDVLELVRRLEERRGAGSVGREEFARIRRDLLARG
jgi:hypothetical protein